MLLENKYTKIQNKHIRGALMLAPLLFFVLGTIYMDFLFARFQNTSFYLSESLLFSTYWLLFLPILHLLWKKDRRTLKPLPGLVNICLASTIHLVCYPVMVWFLSMCFYDHTFSYDQTFSYALTAYSLKTLIIYGLSVPLIFLYKNSVLKRRPLISQEVIAEQTFIASLLVTDNTSNKKMIPVKEILYFSANPPYVNIHHSTKKYLQSGTLKSFETQFDKKQFIRIHKSCIVNIGEVVSYTSRLNGDYDLKLTDGTILRVSRNYAQAFKALFKKHLRLTLK